MSNNIPYKETIWNSMEEIPELHQDNCSKLLLFLTITGEHEIGYYYFDTNEFVNLTFDTDSSFKYRYWIYYPIHKRIN